MKYPSWFENYHSLTEQQFKLINDTLVSLREKVNLIKENDLTHIKEDIIKIANNQKWILIIGGFLAGGVLSIIIKLYF